MPSPASLNPSLASSNRSCTRSLTRSVSRFVPRRFSCCERRPIFEVRVKSFSERLSLKRLNSGSSRYSGSSPLRYVVGCLVCQLGNKAGPFTCRIPGFPAQKIYRMTSGQMQISSEYRSVIYERIQGCLDVGASGTDCAISVRGTTC